MLSPGRSLMDFVDAPVVVGDPDGRAVYVNPAFERAFACSRASATGRPLATLFEGGGREAVLKAVVAVCGGETRARFRLREGDTGFRAVASAVEAAEGRVGVVILLVQDPEGDRLAAFRRELREPLDELASCLVALSATAEGDLEKSRILIAEGLRALERVRKWSESVVTDLSGAR